MDEGWLPAAGWGGENGELLFNGYRVLAEEGEKGSGDGWRCSCTTVNCTLKRDYNGKFYVM